MDHLAHPRDPIHERMICPLICDPSESIGYDFEQYPLVAKPAPYWRRALSIADAWPFFSAEQKHPSNVGDLESFLQQWLFFCQLRTHGFKTDCVDGQFVRSDKLVVELETWFEDAKQSNERQQICEKLDVCLRLSNEALYAAQVHADFNKTLLYSFLTLNELLADALFDLSDGEMRRAPHGILDSAEDRAEMIKNGWCPFEIENAWATFHISTRLFLTNMKKPCCEGEHDRCTSQDCLAATVDCEAYRPKHVTRGCPCDMIGPDPRKIEDCLQIGFPILDFDMNVVQYSGQQYVALSHVWADGLGNPVNMTLPRCQIQRIQNMVDSFRGHHFIEWADAEQTIEREYIEDRKLYFYCDTLCCPVSNPGKKLAISKLFDVYTKATYGLVLDRALDIPYPGALEGALRLTTSKWYHRGWTLQEGGLPRKLVVWFADGIVDQHAMWKDLQRHYRSERAQRSIYVDAISTIISLRVWYRDRFIEKLPERINMVVQNFSRRRLSVPSDEPICLGILLGLGSLSRMEEVWNMLPGTEHGVSQSIIFHKQPRLNSPYRWAPRTLLSANNDLRMAFGSSTDMKGEVTDRGLVVTANAWHIKQGTNFMGRAGQIPDPNSMAPNLVMFRHGDAWYNLQGEDVRNLVRKKKDWYLIFDANVREPSSTSLTALLAHREGDVMKSAIPVDVGAQHAIFAELWRIGHREAIIIGRSIYHLSLLALYFPWFRVLFAKYRARLICSGMDAATRKDDVIRVCHAMRENENPRVSFHLYLQQTGLGRFSEVVQEFPLSEWCVD